MIMNITCCHIALIAIVANIITLAIFAGYTVKLRERTLLLEKKNGAEQKQIDQLKTKLAQLEQRNNDHEQR
jgi:hypothetical protein